MAVSPERLRQARDQVLRYIYENGASQPYFSVSARQIAKDLGLTSEELSAVTMLMHNQRLMPERGGEVGSIGLSDLGQSEAERLGPSVLMRDPPPPSGPVTINASYSTVQVGGAGSVQTAHMSINQSEVKTLLQEIERQLPRLPLDEPTRQEAKELAQNLQTMPPNAASRAGAGALASILSGVGSGLGERLLDLFGLSAG